uniref:Uncharacterized protein n=1 Tax=Cereibacter sphaeroides (strain ATCC 17025 / ATH 2.4.3) TaxID=349102 RepID=A4WS94_CERS5
MRDLYSNIKAVAALAPGVQAAAVNGPAVDMIGARAVVFVLSTGAVAGSGDFGASLEESDDGQTWEAVASADMMSAAPATLEASKTYRLGYLGHKRHVRLALSKAGGTSIAAGAVAILSPLDRPVI